MLPDDPSFYEHARHYATVARAIAYLSALAARQPQALLARDDTLPRALLARVFPSAPTRSTVRLVLRGTNFQIQVWQAMLRTRVGQVLSDTDVAQAVGAPRAQRSVGSALGANTIAWLIPCHRVIRDSGEISHYRWRPERKAAVLGWEAECAGSRNPGPPSA